MRRFVLLSVMGMLAAWSGQLPARPREDKDYLHALTCYMAADLTHALAEVQSRHGGGSAEPSRRVDLAMMRQAYVRGAALGQSKAQVDRALARASMAIGNQMMQYKADDAKTFAATEARIANNCSHELSSRR